jgi:hypothetical protein
VSVAFVSSALSNRLWLIKFRFDVWDALELEASKNDPFTTFHNEKLMRSIQYSGRTEGGWTHQYWAKALLGVISRQRAIVQWRDITFGPYAESTDQFEATFNGLSAFFGHSPQQVSTANLCRGYSTIS